MKRNESYLYKVASQNEDTISELLVNLMSRKYIRDLVLQGMGLHKDIVENIKYSDITTQYTIKNRKRPDIAIVNQETLIFIENKIYDNTDLQKSQYQNEYPDVLINNSRTHKKLVFLIPKNYCHINKLYESQKNYKDKLDILIVCWAQLMEAILSSDITKDNPLIEQTIGFILDTVGLNTARKDFNKGEVLFMYDIKTLSNVYSFINRFDNYCNEACKIISKECEKYINPKKITKESNTDRHIAYWIESKNGGKWPFYLGLSFYENDNFQYNFRILKKIITENVKITEDHFEKQDWVFFKIPNNIFDEDNIPFALANHVKKIFEKYC